jgi:hypothetical protein
MVISWPQLKLYPPLTDGCRDQELRFTVHDSPDYYQMKVSVFNDDKKTDLIGETWVNLQEVVVPGGGQNDLWHNLNYRGKYAGEIRIEITYYDSRPKQEKAVDKMRQNVPSGVTDGARDAMTGPRDPKPAPKRRPLPADPTGVSLSQTASPPQFQTPPRGYQVPQAFVHTQSPLQSVEYSTPPQKFSHSQQGYRQSPGGMNVYTTPPSNLAVTPTSRPMQDEIYDPQENYQPVNSGHRGRYEDQLENRRRSSNFRYDPYEAPAAELPAPFEYNSPPNPDGPPPPPPAHRSNQASPATAPTQSNRQYEDPHLNAIRNVSFETPQQDNFRHSMPAYGQSTSYQAYGPPNNQDGQSSYPEKNVYHDPVPRAHSYDGRISENYRSMQPTVEDDFSSPTNPYPSAYRNSEPQSSNYDDTRYDQVPPTAPLNLTGRGSAASGQYNASASSNQQYHPPPSSSVSPVSYREPSHMGSEVSSQTSYSQVSQKSHMSQNQIDQNDDYMSRSPGGYVPPLPQTLVAGMDPMIAQEVSERIYMENRPSYNQNSGGSSRNRYSEQPNYRQSYPHPDRCETVAFVPAASSAPTVPFVPAAPTYDDRQRRTSANTYTPIIKPQAISPGTRVPARKSVSPSPGPSPEGRRLSGIPFGPDAYNALNPNVSPAAPGSNSQPNFKVDGQHHSAQVDDFDSSAKIILHDGREVDPSDHLPETSWAPEPESRAPKQPDGTRARPTPGGAQPMPSSGPRQSRPIGRPHSMGAVPPSSIQPTGGFSEPPAPASRNRLQKKANRNYGASAAHSSPLAPISSYQDNTFTPKSLPRAQTLDFAGENGYGSYGSGKSGNQGGYARNSVAGPPPIPAKVPMTRDHGSAPIPPNENAWALLEEMKTIDLGGGRSRRRGDYNRAFA